MSSRINVKPMREPSRRQARSISHPGARASRGFFPFLASAFAVARQGCAARLRRARRVRVLSRQLPSSRTVRWHAPAPDEKVPLPKCEGADAMQESFRNQAMDGRSLELAPRLLLRDLLLSIRVAALLRIARQVALLCRRSVGRASPPLHGQAPAPHGKAAWSREWRGQ